MKNISIITTIKHNVGDDFIREGIIYLLKQFFSEEEIKFELIHKHSPFSVQSGLEGVKLDKASSLIDVDRFIPKVFGKDRIKDADVVVQSGAPVYWCHSQISPQNHCADNEWYKPLIKRRFLKSKKNAKLLNLAAGSCQTWNSKGDEFLSCDKCRNYVTEFFELCNLTTTRDTLAQNMLGAIGIKNLKIPCTSIFAIDEYGISAQEPDYVALNYMKGGAHYEFGQKIDYKKWEESFKKFYWEMKDQENFVFVCHNKAELKAVNNFDSKAKTFFSDDFVDYLKFYSKAKFGIMNRIHGAFPILSFGRPAVIIGNDSRAKMAEEVGAKSIFVNNADYTVLMEVYERLKSGDNNFQDRFEKIKAEAYQSYMKAFEQALN